MDSLLSSSIAAAVVIVAATITLVFLLKVLKGTMKLAATFVFVALVATLGRLPGAAAAEAAFVGLEIKGLNAEVAAALGLDREDEGLGRLLIQGKVESHGELLWCGVETLDEELPESLGYLRGRPLISRTYRFVSVGQPLMRITERFPLEDDSGKGDPS